MARSLRKPWHNAAFAVWPNGAVIAEFRLHLQGHSLPCRRRILKGAPRLRWGAPFFVLPRDLTAPRRRRKALRMADETTTGHTLARLEAVIAQRQGADPDSSYVAKLNARGMPVIARKLGEEAVETVIAALAGSRAELVGEAADLLFHLLVLLGAKQVPLAEVLAELDRREGMSGIEEKAARGR